ncbi:hypothetical protein NQ314_012977 [Rhamnusium bicolor]|uniref:Uncharacterized protein n=1 Tax=Rhamnusium bicolor TaxID=1586634 RepID=A0AAV8X891_9CUCU|nr:hypothetical protein NQ314_012977 [Rhamnusium bicolor]
MAVYNSVEDLKALGNLNIEYPLSQLTICMGFFFVYFLEELSHWIITKLPDEPCPNKTKKFSSFTHASVTPLDDTKELEKTKAFIIEDEFENTNNDEVKSIKEFKDDMLSLDENHENIVYDSLSLNSEVAKENKKNLQLNDEAEKNMEEIEHEIKSQQQVMRCVLVVLALSFHAIFEGLALGLQNSIADIWFMFIAVSIHSATILFCMGLELLLAKTKKKIYYYTNVDTRFG